MRTVVTAKDIRLAAAPPVPPRTKRRRRGAVDGSETHPPTRTPPTHDTDTNAADTYTERLLKFIPAESVAGYLALDGMVRSGTDGDQRRVWLIVIATFGALFTWIYLERVQAVKKRQQLAISTASFVIWVFAIGGVFATFSWYEPWQGSVILTMATLLLSLIEPEW